MADKSEIEFLDTMQDVLTENKWTFWPFESEIKEDLRFVSFPSSVIIPSSVNSAVPLSPVCVTTCVNCHRKRETKQRWPGETERKVLCAQCRTPFIYSEGKR